MKEESHYTLTEEEVNKAIDWLNEKGKDWKCAVCQTDAFTVSNIVNLNVSLGEGVMLGRSYTPALMATCQNCGHIVQFSAVALGLMDRYQASRGRSND